MPHSGPVDLSARLARVLPVSLLVALAPWWAALNDDDDCRLLSECLSQGADQLVVLLMLLPFSWVALRLLRVPRSALVILVGGVLGFVGWRLVRDAQHAGVLPPELGPPPLWSVLLVSLVAGVVATAVVGPGRGGLVVRLGVPVLLAASLWPLGAWADDAAARREVEDIAAAAVTTYRPVIAGEGPRGASRSGDVIFLSYTISNGSDITFPRVRLLPTPDGDLCTELAVTASDCTSDGTLLRVGSGAFVEVALVRGGTTLHAQWIETRQLDVDEVIGALRTAPVVTADQLLS